jgi:polar amino acid transport system substrate-binding protein
MKIKTVIVLLYLTIILPMTYPQEHIETLMISTSYQNLLSNENGTGMLDRILIEAFRRMGIKAEIVYNPTERSLVDVNAGLLDGEINRIKGMETSFPNLVRVPEPNMVMRFVAFAKHDFPINGWESIRDKYIGLVRGWKILERNTQGFPKVTRTPTEVELFRMLDKNRLDLALYSLITGYAACNELGYSSIRHLEPPLASREMFLYLHKKHAFLTDRIASSLREMKKDGTYQAIEEEALENAQLKDVPIINE